MKNVQLLSVFLSIILTFGISAGTAYAENSHDYDSDSKDDRSYEKHDDNKKEDTGQDNDKDPRDDNKDKTHGSLEDRLENFCDMIESEKTALFRDHLRVADFKDRLMKFCDITDVDARETAIEDFMYESFPELREDGMILMTGWKVFAKPLTRTRKD